jgi:hypothetical protein
LRTAGVYGGGAVLGFSPQQMDEMGLWQINAVFEGWNKAHAPAESGEPGHKLSEKEKDDIWAWMQEKEMDDPLPNGRIQ